MHKKSVYRQREHALRCILIFYNFFVLLLSLLLEYGHPFGKDSVLHTLGSAILSYSCNGYFTYTLLSAFSCLTSSRESPEILTISSKAYLPAANIRSATSFIPSFNV